MERKTTILVESIMCPVLVSPKTYRWKLKRGKHEYQMTNTCFLLNNFHCYFYLAYIEVRMVVDWTVVTSVFTLNVCKIITMIESQLPFQPGVQDPYRVLIVGLFKAPCTNTGAGFHKYHLLTAWDTWNENFGRSVCPKPCPNWHVNYLFYFFIILYLPFNRQILKIKDKIKHSSSFLPAVYCIHRKISSFLLHTE